MIVATAGHVDHGKTLLVRALTGIDTDRLAEEKRRGLSIDVGFAYLPRTGAQSIGFIDVPGHERFVRNALCGLAATDYVLLVIAADDGPMPQTFEHLAITRLLGCRHAAVVITKVDRVSPAQLAEVETRIDDLVACAGLAGARRFRVSSTSGEGIAALRACLCELAAACPERPDPDTGEHNFRLAVDRCFQVRGAGTVVTGTVFAGELQRDEPVVRSATGDGLRVRELRVHDAKVDYARAGQRCALNLAGAGLRRAPIRRGEWITAPQAPAPVSRFDASLRLLEQNRSVLAHWTPVHLHLGSAQTTARVALLERGPIAPGGEGRVQIVSDRPLGAAFGDRFIVRDWSARRTLGGGRVIDIFASRRGRAQPRRLACLEALALEDPGAALGALLKTCPAGVDLERFAVNRNLSPEALARLLQSVEMTAVDSAAGRRGFCPQTWRRYERQLIDTLRAARDTQPAISLAHLQSLSKVDVPAEIFARMVESLHRQSRLGAGRDGIGHASGQASFTAADRQSWGTIETAFSQAGPAPLSIDELARKTGIGRARLTPLLARASRAGLVIRLTRDLLITPDSLREIREIVARLAARRPATGFSVAEFRDAAGIGRNRCVELLEALDARRITCRDGATRRLLGSADQAFEKLVAAVA